MFPPFADIASLPEDEQIQMIGEFASSHQLVVGFFVDNDAKADRYIEKLKPYRLKVHERRHDVVKGVVFIRIGPLGN